MDNLNFYYLIELDPVYNSKFPESDFTVDFPGMSQAIVGSEDFKTYDLAIESCTQVLKEKLKTLNDKENKYKIFFEKNQFDNVLPAFGDWENNEVIQIYISDLTLSEYNSILKVRVFFSKVIDTNTFIFDTPKTIQ